MPISIPTPFPGSPGHAPVSMAFEDVAVLLSRAEWDALTAGQRELYRDVVSDTYELLTSLEVDLGNVKLGMWGLP
uniref:KRAB domain-containing protein n=1 Tax=Serinus canaria TaxID=9135 RepID=A0A8C9MRL5_SERCA